MRLRSAYDREILRLALPALGALAAEPLYILVDTAIVGHLGRSELAALGAAATALAVLATFNFLQYGTTAQVARATGAGEDEIARKLVPPEMADDRRVDEEVQRLGRQRAERRHRELQDLAVVLAAKAQATRRGRCGRRSIARAP